MRLLAAAALAGAHCVATAALPVVNLTSPSSGSVVAGASVTVAGNASDADGDMVDHWLEVKNPAGQWSWEGWLTSEPFAGALNGNGSSSSKSGSLQLTTPGTWVFRTTASDDYASYVVSNEVSVTVTNNAPHVAMYGGHNSGTSPRTYTTYCEATDADGNMTKHYIGTSVSESNALTTTTPNAGGSSLKSVQTNLYPGGSGVWLYGVAKDIAGASHGESWFLPAP